MGRTNAGVDERGLYQSFDDDAEGDVNDEDSTSYNSDVSLDFH